VVRRAGFIVRGGPSSSALEGLTNMAFIALRSPDVSPRDERRASVRAAHFLALAAAPTFAIMAGLTSIFGDATHGMSCFATAPASPLSGMVAMYVLMSAFHLAPWLKLISR